jgi:hypothetical protein
MADDTVHTNERIVEMLERVLVELEAIRIQQNELATALHGAVTSDNG